MSKYTVRVLPINDAINEENSGWKTEIVRRVTKRKTIVSKQQDGFESQEQAQAWGDEQMKAFMKVEAARKERRS